MAVIFPALSIHFPGEVAVEFIITFPPTEDLLVKLSGVVPEIGGSKWPKSINIKVLPNTQSHFLPKPPVALRITSSC